MNKITSFKTLAIILLASLVVSGCIPQEKQNPSSQLAPIDSVDESEPAASLAPGESFLFTAIGEEQNAFQFLQESAELEYTESDFGVFITGINGIAAGEDQFWALYHNGEMAQVGVSELTLNDGDTIELRLEEIE